VPDPEPSVVASEPSIAAPEPSIVASEYSIAAFEPSIVASEQSIAALEPSIVASESSIAAFEPSIVASDPSVAAPETSVAAYTPSDAVRSASYYALLADDEKVLYTSLYKAAAQREASVKFAGELDDTKIKRVIKSLAFDHPELAWLINGFVSDTTAKDGQVGETEVFFKYNDLVGSADQVTQELEAAAAKILTEAKKYSTIEERERYVHDILNRSVTYMHGIYDQNAYGALVGQQAVCVGISSAFKYLLDRLDIPNYIVFGKMDINGTPENHAWNLVVIDGRCYNVDVTSDNINITRGNQTRNEVDHRLFNKSDSDFRSRGYVRESEYSENAVKLPECW
jgi:transglutaminase/protease-like cytokinesis protein 3